MAKKKRKKAGKPKTEVKTEAVKNVGPPPKLPSAWKITKSAWRVVWQNKNLFIAITLIYGILSLILVQGITGGTNISSLKSELNGSLGSLASAFSVFTTLIGSSGNSSSQTAGGYQLPLGVITSLAIIWALRQILAGKKAGIRDAYYHGMYPLVPFVLVILLIGLQLLPLIIGSTIYNLVVANGIAVNFFERMAFLLVFLAGTVWSIYMISSSLFALYIVTLPEMTPIKAIRSARELAKGRRWPIILRLIFLPIVLVVVAAIIMVPIIIVLAVLAKWVFFVLSMFTLVAVNAYLYTLYRELLNE